MNFTLGIVAAIGGVFGIWIMGTDDWVLRAYFYAVGALSTGACCQMFSSK
jgi:fructose-specific phosphotransferase system IIC component